MNNSNGVYPLRLRQLRAIAENLCMLADRHREDHDYVVAYALYTRALSVAQQIHIPQDDGNVLAPESGLTSKLLSTYCALERVVERHLLLYRWPDFIRRI